MCYKGRGNISVVASQGCARAGVRVDTWVESGTEVTPFYDSLIGKLMVHGSSREDAIERMVAALAGTVLGGIPSNLEYCGAIVGSPGFREGALWGWCAAVAGVCTGLRMHRLWAWVCCQTFMMHARQCVTTVADAGACAPGPSLCLETGYGM